MDQSKSVAMTTVSIVERQQAVHGEYPHLREHPRISVRRGDYARCYHEWPKEHEGHSEYLKDLINQENVSPVN